MSNGVFLGLVTYPGTSFPESSGPDGLLCQLREGLESRGVTVIAQINGDNLYSDHTLDLNRDEVRRSIAAELGLERRWREHLTGHQLGLGARAMLNLRRLRRSLQLAPPWRSRLGPNDRGPTMLRRLINIELSHLDLLTQGVARGAQWILIIEDDARPEALESFIDGFLRLIGPESAEGAPQFVNVSRSFDEGALGVEHLLTVAGDWDSAGRIRVESASRPFTNTVCAVLYRGEFAESLLSTYSDIPLSPVLPIDWKLNEALLRLVDKGVLGSGDCWTLRPAPIAQGSMH